MIQVHAGQTWKRRDGSTFTVERIEGKYARYWLAAGSRPQFRDIRIDRLTRAYTLVAPHLTLLDANQTAFCERCGSPKLKHVDIGGYAYGVIRSTCDDCGHTSDGIDL